MPEVLILQGLPGSGKTTLALETIQADPRWRRVNRDDLRAMLGVPYSPANEALVARARDTLIAQCLLLGYSVIVDDTNLQEHAVNQIKAVAVPFGADIRLCLMPTPIEECIRRDSLRPRPVGEARIREMAAAAGLSGRGEIVK